LYLRVLGLEEKSLLAAAKGTYFFSVLVTVGGFRRREIDRRF
jgi:hypothetical protein